MTRPILVIGASGRTGREVVKLLLAEGVPVRAATRNPGIYPTRPGGAVEAIRFDFDRRESFAPALQNVEKVFLMARPADNHSDEAAMPFVDEAKSLGVRHIVNLTAMGAEQDAGFALRILERYIEDSGIAFTHLRPNWFMQNFDSGPMLADIKGTGALHLPAGDAQISFVDIRDVAAVACACLSDSGHRNQAYTLTGGEALDHAQVMTVLGNVSGRSLAYVPLTEETACTGLARAGVPVDRIERWRIFYRKVRAGLCAPVSPAVQDILGHPPIRFEQYACDHAAAWR